MHRNNGQIEILAFASVVFAGVLIGFIAHELFHVLTIKSVSSFTINFGSKNTIFTVCCLAPNEKPFEEAGYLVQFIATIVWILFNQPVFRKDKYL